MYVLELGDNKDDEVVVVDSVDEAGLDLSPAVYTDSISHLPPFLHLLSFSALVGFVQFVLPYFEDLDVVMIKAGLRALKPSGFRQRPVVATFESMPKKSDHCVLWYLPHG